MVHHLHVIDGGGDAVRSPELASAVEIIDQRYEVRRRIGAGATGSVYEAFDRTLDRQVAIKVLEPGRAQAADREAHILARIRHRNVVAIHDYGVAPGFRYLVLELLVGRDLRSWLAERPPTDEVLARLLEAGRGLAAAHAAGLVHRDFKPSNLILTEGEATHGRATRAVVIDFGLARNLDTLEDGRLSESGREWSSSSSSLAYLAPEYLDHDVGDARSDQFAWCAVVWEALTGSNPFRGDDPSSRRQSIARGPDEVRSQPPAAEFVADVSGHVGRALRRGLSLSPELRFASMTELLDHIEQAPSLAPRRQRRPLLSALVVAATFALGWGLAPDPVVEHAVSDGRFDPASTAASIKFDAAKRELAAGNTVAAKAEFDAATEFVMELEKGSPAYCRFAAQIEGFADGLLAAGDLPRGRALYSRAIGFAENCERSRADIEKLESKKRSSREAFLANRPHEPRQCVPPAANESSESGESFQWSEARSEDAGP